MEKIRIRDTEHNVFTQGEGQTVLFVHGFPFDSRLYLPACAWLKGKCRCLVPDLRGFGESKLPEGMSICSMEQYADDLIELLDQLDIREKIILCGLSMGGYIAMEFVRKYEDRVARLILCDTRSDQDSEVGRSKRIHLAQTVVTTGMAPIADAMISNLLSEESFQEFPWIVDYLREMILSQDPVGVAAAARGMAERKDTTWILKTLKIPVYFLCGSEDRISSPEIMAQMAELVQDKAFSIMPGCAHLVPLESPQRFAEIIDFNLYCLDFPEQDM